MRNRTVLLAVLALCLLVPVAVRFSFSIVLVIADTWLMLAITAVRLIVKKIGFGPLSSLAELCFSVLATILFVCTVSAISPVLGTLLYIYFFLAAVASYLLLFPDPSKDPEAESMSVAFKSAVLKSLQCNGYVLLFGLVREIIGFGCISLPSTTGFTVIRLFDFNGSDIFRFVVSTGGTLILIGMLIAVGRYMRKQMEIAKRIKI